MRHLGRRLVPRPFLGSRGTALAAALALLLTSALAEAREVTIRGQAMQGFGRIELRFDAPTKVTLRNTGSVLVVGFGEPARIRAEKLIAELGAYVANSRRDPDETGLRLALPRPYRTNLLEAGERVFIDLLPENWTGLPPGLPPEVVAELAARARAAEEKLRAEEARRARMRGTVALRLAELPNRTRLIFEPPAGTPIRAEAKDGTLDGWFEGNLGFDLGGNRPKSAAGVEAFEAEDEAAGVRIRLTAAAGRTLRHFTEEGALVVDLLAPEPPPAPPPVATAPETARPPAPEPAPASGAAAGAAEERPARAEPAKRDIPGPDRARPASETAQAPLPIPLGTDAPQPPSGTVRAEFAEKEGASSLTLPFGQKTAAAAFERGGRVTVLFQSAAAISVGAEEQARRSLGFESIRQDGPFSILAFASRPERPIRLVPDGTSWTIVRGGATALPSDDLLVTRATAADGRSEVAIALGDATTVRWLLHVDDTPLAVVPTTGRQGMATGRRFVEFALLPTIQGVVVQPNADEVKVTLGRGGVLVSRRSGLFLSSVGGSGTIGQRMPLLISAEAWHEAVDGNVFARIRTQLGTAAEAPRSDKSKARLALATTLLANGLSHEAAGLLAVAAQDDPVFARGREALLMAGIAAVRSGRTAAARAHLSDEILAGDPEAGLWRAALDARERNWPQALAALRRAEPILSRYPDDLTGAFRLTTIRAAIGAGDLGAAQDALFALQQLPAGTVERDEGDLAQARLDEAAGRAKQALAIYERLASSPSLPVAAEASLRSITLGRQQARITAADAIRRLEALSLSWRGDEIELGTLAQLARLYGETGRWRDMLSLARRADARFPDHETTRTLHDETARRFEALFLGPEGSKIDAVEYLALYYDFREFSPVGRRGDEIVRRIADRLVELDLLDQAAALLQHQVDKRLTGLPRTIVATRLATIRLMGGKPALAISALVGSRMADLPAPVRRLRNMIEAQAQADLTRVDLALEAIENEEGADFSRLRAAILFGARRWREAGEAFEGLVGTRWQGKEPLTTEERQDVIRAILADVMAGEWIALDRVKAKFAAKMADSPDAKLFESLIRPRSIQTPDFRAALREASRAGSLRRFLGDWARISDLPSEPAEEAGKEAGREPDRKPG